MSCSVASAGVVPSSGTPVRSRDSSPSASACAVASGAGRSGVQAVRVPTRASRPAPRRRSARRATAWPPPLRERAAPGRRRAASPARARRPSCRPVSSGVGPTSSRAPRRRAHARTAVQPARSGAVPPHGAPAHVRACLGRVAIPGFRVDESAAHRCRARTGVRTRRVRPGRVRPTMGTDRAPTEHRRAPRSGEDEAMTQPPDGGRRDDLGALAEPDPAADPEALAGPGQATDPETLAETAGVAEPETLAPLGGLAEPEPTPPRGGPRRGLGRPGRGLRGVRARPRGRRPARTAG